MAWSAEFGEPIELSDGLTFRSLRDAATNILKLPKADQDERVFARASCDASLIFQKGNCQGKAGGFVTGSTQRNGPSAGGGGRVKPDWRSFARRSKAENSPSPLAAYRLQSR
jgi:hypothetical protein